MELPKCLGCGGPAPSWAQACSERCADRVHAKWSGGHEPLSGIADDDCTQYVNKVNSNVAPTAPKGEAGIDSVYS
jgi:hypothetical protein